MFDPTVFPLWADYSVASEDKAPLEPEQVVRNGGIYRLVLNSYRCIVLETKGIVIGDIDAAEKNKIMTPQEMRQAIDCIRKVAAKTRLPFRIYQTASGLRYIITRPVAKDRVTMFPRAMQILKATHCDDRYIVCCEVAGTFRARLTPKPWRVASPLHIRVTRYLGTINPSRCRMAEDAKLTEVVLLHDAMTHAHITQAGLQLA